MFVLVCSELVVLCCRQMVEQEKQELVCLRNLRADDLQGEGVAFFVTHKELSSGWTLEALEQEGESSESGCPSLSCS